MHLIYSYNCLNVFLALSLKTFHHYPTNYKRNNKLHISNHFVEKLQREKRTLFRNSINCRYTCVSYSYKEEEQKS